MAKVIKWKDVSIAKMIKAIKEGKIFVYPTDTIYGIGCNAKDKEAVMKIRAIKKRDEKPFSIIAPSKKWIKNNFYIKKAYLDKLPGPYTYLLKPKKKNVVCKEVYKGSKKIGVRIPKHQFSQLVSEANVPFITTSVNKSGKKPLTNPDKIGWLMKRKIDYVLDQGVLNNKASTVIDLTEDVPKILRRG